MSVMVDVNAAHPGHEVDWAGRVGPGHLGFGSDFLELGPLLELAVGLESCKWPQHKSKGDQDVFHECSRHTRSRQEIR